MLPRILPLLTLILVSLVAGCSGNPCAAACDKVNTDCPGAKDAPGAQCESLCQTSQQLADGMGCGSQYGAALACIVSATDKTTCSGNLVPPSCAPLESASKACMTKVGK
jgi:hypothetical protein